MSPFKGQVGMLAAAVQRGRQDTPVVLLRLHVWRALCLTGTELARGTLVPYGIQQGANQALLDAVHLAQVRGYPFDTGCSALSYSGNPGVDGVSYIGGLSVRQLLSWSRIGPSALAEGGGMAAEAMGLLSVSERASVPVDRIPRHRIPSTPADHP